MKHVKNKKRRLLTFGTGKNNFGLSKLEFLSVNMRSET